VRLWPFGLTTHPSIATLGSDVNLELGLGQTALGNLPCAYDLLGKRTSVAEAGHGEACQKRCHARRTMPRRAVTSFSGRYGEFEPTARQPSRPCRRERCSDTHAEHVMATPTRGRTDGSCITPPSPARRNVHARVNLFGCRGIQCSRFTNFARSLPRQKDGRLRPKSAVFCNFLILGSSMPPTAVASNRGSGVDHGRTALGSHAPAVTILVDNNST
jgi:hypothetical protein